METFCSLKSHRLTSHLTRDRKVSIVVPLIFQKDPSNLEKIKYKATDLPTQGKTPIVHIICNINLEVFSVERETN